MGGPGSGRYPRKKKENTGHPKWEDEARSKPVPTFPRDYLERVFVAPAEAPPSFPNQNRSKYTIERVARILDSIIARMPARMAALRADINDRTFYQWMQDRPDFKQLVGMAEAIRMEDLLQRYQRQEDYNWAAIMTYLERTHGEFFARRAEVQHVVSGTIGLDARKILADPDLIEKASALEAALQRGEIIEGEFTALPEHTEESK